MPRGRYNDVINDRVFQLIQEMGVSDVLLWQWLLTDAQIINAAQMCQRHGLKLWLDLRYEVDAARSIVEQLGDLCSHYEVCKQPHGPGYCECDAVTYPSRWNAVVNACREVAAPDTMFGGPVVGSFPGTSPRSETWARRWLENADIREDTFISWHAFTSHGTGTRSGLIAKASSMHMEDIATTRELCRAIIGRELPIAVTEINWTSQETRPGRWDLEEDFIRPWTFAAMETFETYEILAVFFWNLGGVWENAMSLITPAPDYTPKPQYFAIRDYIVAAPTPPVTPIAASVAASVGLGTPVGSLAGYAITKKPAGALVGGIIGAVVGAIAGAIISRGSRGKHSPPSYEPCPECGNYSLLENPGIVECPACGTRFRAVWEGVK